MNFALKTRNFAFKMMNLAALSPRQIDKSVERLYSKHSLTQKNQEKRRADHEKRLLEQMKPKQKEVSFRWKNPVFLFKNPDFLIKNPDFLLKNVDVLTKPGETDQKRRGCERGEGQARNPG